MRLLRMLLDGHRSVEVLDFEAGPFTVLFGKNNAGKTNILETIYGLFNPGDDHFIRRTHAERPSNPQGALYAELDSGLTFDDQVSVAVSSAESAHRPCRVAFTNTGLLVGDLGKYYEYELDAVYPGNWRDDTKDAPSVHVLFLDWQFQDLHSKVEDAVARLATSRQQTLRRSWPWLETVQASGEHFAYRVPLETEVRVEQLALLATDLLPDFVDGSIRAHVTSPTLWGRLPKVSLEYDQLGLTQCADLVDAAGRGAARWMAAAIQIALHLMEEYPDLIAVRDLDAGAFSRHVLLIDEPEAHLHPQAVASMVRWCQLMVRLGFTVIVASHHEEFLRTTDDDLKLVHVTRSADLVHTTARALTTKGVRELQQLALDVGMHPASVLALNKAILFVEGPLDEAVLDAYFGLKLDAAGIKIIPIHGTKNLEGLVSVELVYSLGIKMGILTDATEPSTMAERSGRKRSSEERKALKVLQIAREKGLPEPTLFGIPEADLLFALPADAIRRYLKGPFPGWNELVAECRQASGKGPSDSVDWKTYAFERFGLDIRTPAGVGDIARKFHRDGVDLPSVREVVDNVVLWATSSTTASEDNGEPPF